jgi:hypothetical protein
MRVFVYYKVLLGLLKKFFLTAENVRQLAERKERKVNAY